MFRDKMKVALKDMMESLGKKGTIKAVKEMLKDEKIKADDFSVKELWESCVDYESKHSKGNSFFTDVHEAVSSDMFPVITGEIINSKIISTYDNTANIGDKITTVVPSKMEKETYAGFDSSEGPLEVQQGAEYEDSTIGEKYTTVRHQKFGRLISVTEEMVYFDKTAQIMMMAARIGEKARGFKEQKIVKALMDLDSYKFYNPSDVETDVYSSGNSNLNSSCPFGEAGVKENWKSMTNQTDEEGDPLAADISRIQVVVPIDLYAEGLQMSESLLVPEGNENAKNIMKGHLEILTSYWVGADSTTTWYASPNFSKGLIWSEVWPLETFTMREGNEFQFRRDIKYTGKVRFYGNPCWLDFRWAYKNEA